MGQKIGILVVEPGKAPRPETVNGTLEEVEGMLGGPAQLGCFLPQRVMLVSRQDTDGLVPNRCMPGKKEVIHGTFLLCGIPEEGNQFASLSNRDSYGGVPGHLRRAGTVHGDRGSALFRPG